MMYTSQKYIRKNFTTHSRNDFDFSNESVEILPKFNEKTRNLGFLWISPTIWWNLKSNVLTWTMNFFTTMHPKNLKQIFSSKLWCVLLKNIIEKILRHTVAMVSIFEMKVVKFCSNSMKKQEIWDSDGFQ